MIKVIALDVGGTNIRIASVEIRNRKPIIKKEKQFLTKDVTNLSTVINSIREKEEVACIGFAGPIVEKEAKLTNADLRVNTDQLKKETKLKEIRLLNDFHVVGYGLPFLKKKEFYCLNKAVGFDNNVEMVVGPGTGLGKAYIIENKVYPCEGGLTTLGVGDIGDYALLDYIRTKYNVASVYYEDVISGRGLLDIYDHLEIKTNMELNMKIMRLIRQEPVNKAKLITKYSSKDKLCNMTLQIFTKFYARFVRNSVLNLISSRVYLVGGITSSILPSLKKEFMQEFLKHRVYQGMLKKVNVCVVLNTNVGLLGAGAVAGRLV